MGWQQQECLAVRTALFALALVGASYALAEAPAITPVPRQTVYLSGDHDLQWLRRSKPDHYARAERILAAANHLCRPGLPQTEFAAASARDVRCAAMLLRTSNPPQFSLSFTLDDTRYIALVTVTDDPPRAIPAR
jgi:hypothetical protein